MPHPTDKSDLNTLPDPELNPLLNPVLAAHMGRWAEVYFTNPPEKREQAVSELLRELASVSPPELASFQVAQEDAYIEPLPAELPSSTSAKFPPVLTCLVCAYNNAAGQRFCGMCAAPLQAAPEASAPQVEEFAPAGQTSWYQRSLGGNDNPVEDTIEPAVSFAGDREHPPVPEHSSPLPEKDLFHLGVKFSDLASYRSRLYVVAVLAIFLVMLGYMGWRGAKAFSDGPATKASPAAIVPSAHPAPTVVVQPRSATENAFSTGTPPTPPVQDQIQPASSQSDRASDTQSTARIIPVAAGSGAVAAPGQSGAQDLATAEKFLNGGRGATRDSGEAAQWLWKAVAKGNPSATLALSDLYLRGDGVPKSCDQARLLLDAAARKGSRAAAEQLQNLQAFGCQ